MTKSKFLKSNSKELVFERLRNKNEFEIVYKNGKSIISGDKKLKAKYLFTGAGDNIKVKLGLSVISKKGNSVWRNRTKRILRVAVRKGKDILQNLAIEKNSNLLIIFSPYSISQNNSKEIYLKDILGSVLEIINRIKLTSAQ